jgi:hypothetical protein
MPMSPGDFPMCWHPSALPAAPCTTPLVGLAAAAADIALVTRDVRAVPTYAAVGATIEIMT